MNITIHRNGQNHGPYNIEQVKQHLAAGSLVEKDLAWFEGCASWISLREVVAAVQTAPPPLPIREARTESLVPVQPSSLQFVGNSLGVPPYGAGVTQQESAFEANYRTGTRIDPISYLRIRYTTIYLCLMWALWTYVFFSSGLVFIRALYQENDKPSDVVGAVISITQSWNVVNFPLLVSAAAASGLLTIRRRLPGTRISSIRAYKPGEVQPFQEPLIIIAATTTPSHNSARSFGVLLLLACAWAIVFWVGEIVLMVITAFATAPNWWDPASEIYLVYTLSGPLFAGCLLASAILSYMGELPATKRLGSELCLHTDGKHV